MTTIWIYDRSGSGYPLKAKELGPMTPEERQRLAAFHAQDGQPEAQRFTTIRTNSHTFEFDRVDGTLRISDAGDQQFLSSAETAILLDLLYTLRDDILLRGDTHEH